MKRNKKTASLTTFFLVIFFMSIFSNNFQLISSIEAKKKEDKSKFKLLKEKENRNGVVEDFLEQDMDAPDPNKKNDDIKINFNYASKPYLNKKNWFFKTGFTVHYFTLGSEINSVLNQLDGMFAGSSIELPLMSFKTSMSLQTDATVSRAATNFVPTGNIGFGYKKGNHKFEFDLGTAGMVPLNTLNVKTEMTMTEAKTCSNANLNECRMAELGFVEQSTGKGRYSLSVNINEEVWFLNPNFYYDYTFTKKKWGEISVGGSLGLMIISLTQYVEFYGKRLDTSNLTDPYTARIMEGSAVSSAMNNMGPIIKIYAGYKRPVYKQFISEIRIGFNYGFINITRHVDGYGKVIMGDSLVASFPVESMGFKNVETNKLETIGAFFQASILF